MKYIATVAGTAFELEINNEGEIIVNGKRQEIDFFSVPDQPVYSLIIDGRSYEAHVNPNEGILEVLVQGRLYQVHVEDERQKRLRESSIGTVSASGDFALKSPMPGMVVDIPVEVGQEVQPGDNLVILESMKMQNELKAPRSGKVLRIRVKVGDRVEQNQVLVVVE